MKTKYQIRRGFTLVELLVVIAIIATLAGVGVPVIIAQKKKGDRSQAINNAKEIGTALFGFDQDFGSFPSDATAVSVKESNPDSTLTLGKTNSNDYFRQLLVSGLQSEKPFYAKAAYTKKPDNVMTGDKALAAGEVGFAYIMKTDSEALPSSGNTGRPILVTSVFEAKTDGTFDPDVYDRMAVVQRIDNSASAEQVRTSDKKANVGGGKTLFETGADTVWGTDITPVIKAPLKAP
ncbi:MAG: prepilin-type N-terminal cleavage/methylation domain-containing protein [Verrucomicrobiota bacterium]